MDALQYYFLNYGYVVSVCRWPRLPFEPIFFPPKGTLRARYTNIKWGKFSQKHDEYMDKWWCLLAIKNYIFQPMTAIIKVWHLYCYKSYIYIYINKFSQKHNYEYMAKWWCLLTIENYMFRPIAAIIRFLQILTIRVIYESYIIYKYYGKKFVKTWWWPL